jgi:two-component system sensor histidine kinase KdpD
MPEPHAAPTASAVAAPSPAARGPQVASNVARWRRIGTHLRALAYMSLGLIAAGTLTAHATLADQAMISLLTVVLVALSFDVAVSLTATLANILAFDFFFIPPRFAFAWSDAKSTLIFVADLVVAYVISGLGQRLRHQEQIARRSAFVSGTLYELNVELSGANQPKQLAAATTRHLERLFTGRGHVLLSAADGSLEIPPTLGRATIALAERVWAGQPFCVEPITTGYAIWIPLRGIHEVLGALGLEVAEPFEQDSENGRLFAACARELATALERAKLASAVRRSELEAETERMRSSLLSAVSHDLKTPLAAIVAAATTLLSHRDEIEAVARHELLANIVGEGERLNRLVQNLLSITRLESPTIELRRSAESVEEIVGATLDRLEPVLKARELELDLAPDLPCVSAEPALVQQVLSNLIENALRYTPASAAISITARSVEGAVSVRVADRGPGVPEHEWDKVFEKFYRGSQADKSDGGVGLGLTICRAIVRAHGGRIALRSRAGGGTVVEFTLPVARSPRRPDALEQVGA